MGNSTIKRKRCKCSEDCKMFPTLGFSGYYSSHAPKEIKEAVGSRRKAAQKNKNSRMAQQSKLRGLNRAINGESELDLWFSFQMIRNDKKCENCGADLSHYSERDWRGSQHHIIDKSPTNGCPSVATNPYNHGVLGWWCCHGQWHTNYQNAQKMPFFQIAKQRFELFKDSIADEERKKIPECFL